jgi:hypothetical protein
LRSAAIWLLAQGKPTVIWGATKTVRRQATREHVQLLEKDYDAAVGEKKEGLPDGVDSDQLMRELEDFLRRQRESGGGEPPR